MILRDLATYGATKIIIVVDVVLTQGNNVIRMLESGPNAHCDCQKNAKFHFFFNQIRQNTPDRMVEGGSTQLPDNCLILADKTVDFLGPYTQFKTHREI